MPTKEQIAQYLKAKREQEEAGYGQNKRRGSSQDVLDAIERGVRKEDKIDQAVRRTRGYEDGGNVLQSLVNTDDYMNEFKQPMVTQEDVVNAELEKLNEEVKRPSIKTKPELVEEEAKQELEKTPIGQALQDRSPSSTPEVDPMLARYKQAIEDYQAKLNEKPEENQVMNWLTGIGKGANVISKMKGTSPGEVEYYGDTQKARGQASKKQNLDGLQNLQNMYAKYMEMQKKKEPKEMSEKEKLQVKKLQKELNAPAAPAAPTFAEKEEIKARVKDEIAAKKENRETRKQTVKAVDSIDEQIKKVKDARNIIEKASKTKGLSDTGPIDQYLNKFTDQGQKIEQAINSVSLDTMTKMFAGMSKAIDSDAERAFFQASQPSVGKYPEANLDILNKMIKNLESLKAKNKGYLQEISPSGERKETKPQVSEVKRKTKDGRTAIFNAETKEFLRYE